jgi:hypothetical protein
MTRVDEIERLGRLKEQGILTDEEFQREKSKILKANTKPMETMFARARQEGLAKATNPAVAISGCLLIIIGLGWLVADAGNILTGAVSIAWYVLTSVLSLAVMFWPFIAGGLLYLMIDRWVSKIARGNDK